LRVKSTVNVKLVIFTNNVICSYACFEPFGKDPEHYAIMASYGLTEVREMYDKCLFIMKSRNKSVRDIIIIAVIIIYIGLC
jgi:hypothetical protein